MPRQSMPDHAMTIKEVAAYLQIKKYTAYRLVQKGKIPGIKVGGQWRFLRKQIDDMFNVNGSQHE